ncbi:hypothetical protein [Sphaerisporangium sp. TRM90804]|uniref:hypothetical protein n=1 Tax=Sphaerisporangium sp. TRM90804 TaxID=3031113 RepID=UPI00244AB396|nr:hypothetical protein [Sphaerisporangium sp. TRM90804]MDH2428875.1 hypothetical protein [Sphaerisporangium sp. TRM90804]
MSGRVRVTAVSAVLASLGLTGAVLLATAPMTAPRANAAQVAAADPTDQVEPTDPYITESGDPGADPELEPEPTVTITVTQSPDPVVTTTRTITPKATRKVTKTPKASPTKTAPVVPPAPVEPPPTVPSAPVIPSSDPVVPPTTPTESVPVPEVSLAQVSPPAQDTATAPSTSFEEPTPDSVPIEIRNASPEYDQLTLSRKLAIPGVLLAVLVMLGVFIFEGRIRRMAHAAAVRRAGPRGAGRHRGADLAGGYPMPGYPIYHDGTAYAPIISFVPVQGFPNAPGQEGYQPVYGDPTGFDAYGRPEQGFGAPGAVGPAEPWPRREPQGGSGAPGDATAVIPAAGSASPKAGPGEPFAGKSEELGSHASDGRTLRGPLPGEQGAQPAEPRRGLLGRFRRDKP